MKIFLILKLCLLAFLGCDYFTDETEAEASPVAPAPANWEALLQDRGNWALLAMLDRDVRQDRWHEFHVRFDIETMLLQAYVDGREFLFVIDSSRSRSLQPVQFYFAQPEGITGLIVDNAGNPLSARVDVFYPSPPTWFDHWARHEINPEQSGFVASFDAGHPGWKFQHPDNRAVDWIGGSVEFRATREGAVLVPYESPHIKEGYVLKIFAR